MAAYHSEKDVVFLRPSTPNSIFRTDDDETMKLKQTQRGRLKFLGNAMLMRIQALTKICNGRSKPHEHTSLHETDFWRLLDTTLVSCMSTGNPAYTPCVFHASKLSLIGRSAPDWPAERTVSKKWQNEKDFRQSLLHGESCNGSAGKVRPALPPSVNKQPVRQLGLWLPDQVDGRRRHAPDNSRHVYVYATKLQRSTLDLAQLQLMSHKSSLMRVRPVEGHYVTTSSLPAT